MICVWTMIGVSTTYNDFDDRILTTNLPLENERLLCIELKPLEGQLMMQTRSSLEFLIPTDKYVTNFIWLKADLT